jgi:LysR family glycine cleavage system transcriptional activator
LVGPELASGKLKKLSDVTLPGYGFYLVHAKRKSKDAQVQFFLRWAQEIAKQR